MAGKIKILVASIAVAAGLGIAVYGDFWGGRGDGTGNLVLYGNVDIRQVDLAFNVEGRIAAMTVEEGDRVTAGQVIASLADERFADAVRAAAAVVESRRAILARLEAGSRAEEIAKARADVRAAEATWEGTKLALARQKALAANRVASQQTLDNAEVDERAAKARLDALTDQLNLVIAGPRKEDIEEARAQLKGAEADLALTRHRLDDTRLVVREDGIVLTRAQEPGAVILANTPVYTIALADPVWVRTYVSETALGRLRPGMSARVTTDSNPDRPYDGWVGFISPTAEFTPKTVETPEIRTSLVYRLRVYVRHPDGGLRQGMPVTVTLMAGSVADAGR